MYKAGLHIIATISTEKTQLLEDYVSFKEKVSKIIEEHQLNKLGEIYHNFGSGGYTAVVCLSESHLSIHTWPEHGLLNIDIYLSNHERTNDNTVQSIFGSLLLFFGGTAFNVQQIVR